ncbi:MAG: PadR family transcriptional regulator [Caldilineaceae bacterium]|nr:PadR family transcriptional regulator [Caldilineaceae bacterium]
MSLKHALLGFLNYQPYTGYDLKTKFDSSVRHFWSADQSQIYRTLTQLAGDGLAEMTIVHQEDRPDRKVYSITEAGREELRSFLTGPMPMHDARSAPLIMVFFAGMLPDEEALAIFEQAAGFMRAMLAALDDVPTVIEHYKQEVGSAREAFFWGLTLESGRAQTEAQLAWVESVIQRIKSGEVPPLGS